MRAIVLGATGQIGNPICKALLEEGYDVVACHRGGRALQANLKKAGVTEVVGDRHGSADIGGVLRSGADLLVDVVPMAAADADQLLAHKEDFGTLAIVSTGAVYADDEGRTLAGARQRGFPQYPDPIPETQRTVEPDAESYAGQKVALERRLLDEARCDVIVLRPGTVHGIYAQDLREVWFLKRMLDGRPFVPMAYDGSSRFHTCAAATIAAALIAGLKAGGTHILNVGDGDAPSVLEIGEMLLGPNSATALLPFPGPPRDGVGMSPWSVPHPIGFDTAALAKLIGPIPLYRDMIRPTAEWAIGRLRSNWAEAFPKLARYGFPLFDYAAEDAFSA